MTTFGLPYMAEAISQAALTGANWLPYANMTPIKPPKNEADGPKTASSWYDWNAYALGSVPPRVKLSVSMSQAGVTFVQSQIVLPVGRFGNVEDRNARENVQSITAGYLKSSITLPSFDLSDADMGYLRALVQANAGLLILNGATGQPSNTPLLMLARGNTSIAG